MEMQMNQRSTFLALTAAIICGGMLIALADDESDRSAIGTESGIAASASASETDIENIARAIRRPNLVSSTRVYDDLTDLLPSVAYKRGAQEPQPVCELVVHGSIISVEPGVGFENFDALANGGDRPGSVPDTTEVPFDDAAADFRTVHTTIEMLDRLGNSPAPEARTVEVGIVIDKSTDFNSFRRGLQSVASYVFFLEANNPVFAYAHNIFSIAGNGSLLTVVGEQGRLSLPGLAHEDEEDFLRNASTLNQLKSSADRPVEVRRVPEEPGTRLPARTATSAPGSSPVVFQ